MKNFSTKNILILCLVDTHLSKITIVIWSIFLLLFHILTMINIIFSTKTIWYRKAIDSEVLQIFIDCWKNLNQVCFHKNPKNLAKKKWWAML